MRDEPSDHLVPPRGLLLVARAGDTVLGCAGLRPLPNGIGEVTRVRVAVNAHGRGLGSRPPRNLEDEARQRQLTTLRLDTRGDLVEARRRYARRRRSGAMLTAAIEDVGPMSGGSVCVWTASTGSTSRSHLPMRWIPRRLRSSCTTCKPGSWARSPTATGC